MDEILLSHKIDLIKIDAEGAELEVIHGADVLFKSNPNMALIVELGISHFNRREQALDQLLSDFTRLDMIYRVITAWKSYKRVIC